MMTARPIPLRQPEPQPELISVEEIAKRWEISPNTVRRWITADMADGGNRIPGGRREGGTIRIIRAVFDRACRDGVEPARGPEYPALDVPAAIDRLRALAAEANGLADSLAGGLAAGNRKVS